MNNSLKYTIVLAFIGIILTALVIYVERNMYTTNTKNQPFIALGEYLKNNSTKAHLWFEEAMSGDESIDIDKDVYGLLDQSIVTLKTALAGGETEVGDFQKTTDLMSINILDEAIGDVENLRISAAVRWKFRQDMLVKMSSGADSLGLNVSQQAGGELDQEFDAAYEELQETFNRLTEHVKLTVNADNRLLNQLSWVSIALIIVVFAILCVFLYNIQRKMELLTLNAEEKLKEEVAKIEVFSKFIQAIANGDYSSNLEMQDELGEKLVVMRDNLRENADSEQKRIWAAGGMAKMGEILRSDYSTISELFDRIVKFSVEYTKSNQGFLFLVNEEDDLSSAKYLDLCAAYAYDRKKFIEKRIEVGEGLAGQCFVEGKITFLLDFPKEYIKITSGLGDAPPTAIIIVPLKINEVSYGVIELASFHKYQPYEIELIERFAESIASTISTVRINEKTKLLLQQTQQQAEEMRSQEEEMRQNMEELSATQEEMSRKERDYIKKIEELETTAAQ